jgi:uncharacterized protein YdhG (YjbR/CyaY superfamily)
MKETSSNKQKSEGFSAEERAAMKARAKELKAAASKEEAEKDLLSAIAAMPDEGHAMAERLHAIVTANAPGLLPKTWYGMPAYANQDGKVVCFFRGAEKFKERYMTFGFNQEANLDADGMWPIAFALTDLTPANETRIAELVKKAVS